MEIFCEGFSVKLFEFGRNLQLREPIFALKARRSQKVIGKISEN